MLFLRDNALAYTSLVSSSAIPVCLSTAYFSNLAQSDFYLFRYLKHLKNSLAINDEAIILAINDWTEEQTCSVFMEDVKSLEHRRETCTALQGNVDEKQSK